MCGIARCAAIAGVLFFGGNAWSQSGSDSAAQAARTVPDTVLIAKGNSYLENAVARIVVDSLQRKGVRVKIVSVKTIRSYDPRAYRAAVIFSGVRSGRTADSVREFVLRSSDPNSKILISTVYGEPWQDGGQSGDAVAAATRTLRPETIAVRILGFINRTLAPAGTERE
jgi:hypothetical protein